MLRAEVRKHSAIDLKKSQKRLRKLQKQLTELRRQAKGHARVLAGMKRRVAGLRGGVGRAAAAVGRRGRQITPQGIRALRGRLRMTREQFARLVGVSPGSIFGWESGRTFPRRGSLGRLGELRKTGARAARAELSAAGKAVRRRVRGR
ncbi:MAG TPA: helix-turn-helix domain-containing protein [Vicinamibacteria bacterium]|nr:helix-turn-helix domain-containing protein [Vicinamibacteria bacterium]